jgi:hypothetical protein
MLALRLLKHRPRALARVRNGLEGRDGSERSIDERLRDVCFGGSVAGEDLSVAFERCSGTPESLGGGGGAAALFGVEVEGVAPGMMILWDGRGCIALLDVCGGGGSALWGGRGCVDWVGACGRSRACGAYAGGKRGVLVLILLLGARGGVACLGVGESRSHCVCVEGGCDVWVG